MSDLFCPATVILAECADADAARALADALAGRRVAEVWCAEGTTAQELAGVVADSLGVRVRPRAALQGGRPEARDQLVEELESLADEFRGETVLVLAEADRIRRTVRRLAGAQAGQRVQDGTVCELSVDADGWVARSPALGDERPPS